jgi:hypothetical protein
VLSQHLIAIVRANFGLYHSLVVRDGRHLPSGRVLLAEGFVQREAEVINIIAQGVGPIEVG